MKKNRLTIIISVVSGVIVLIILLALFYVFILNGKKSYSDIENKMIFAATDYYKKNKSLLPKMNEQVIVEASTLISNKNLNELSKMNRDNVGCEGRVTVRNNNGYYSYTPYLKCADKYESKIIVNYIKENNKKDDKGNGFYEVNSELVFKGDETNNILSFDNKLWQIIKIDKNQDLMLIAYDQKIMAKNYSWDDRFNEETKKNTGLNDYKLSRMRNFLTDYYNNNDNVSLNAKSKILSKNFCIGGRDIKSTDNSGSAECSSTISDTIGLITVYDFINASLDKNCNKVGDRACQNYNYLLKKSDNYSTTSFLTMTKMNSNTSSVYGINYGYLVENYASSRDAVRPIIYVSGNNIYESGNGSLSNPYKFK